MTTYIVFDTHAKDDNGNHQVVFSSLTYEEADNFVHQQRLKDSELLVKHYETEYALNLPNKTKTLYEIKQLKKEGIPKFKYTRYNIDFIPNYS